jgi:Na+:H+ antiporter, NhaA family
MPTKLTKLFSEFLASEQASGVILILCTIVSITVANSDLGPAVSDFWHIKIGLEAISLKLSLDHWINDGLMAIFFLMIGLEIERELYVGELADLRKSTLPVFAAIGGMVIPAFLHYSLNFGTETQAGIGIPIATDIAFALGILALLGNKVPVALKVFLAALAIIDDLCAIIVIAVFYTHDLSLVYLFAAVCLYSLLLLFNRLGINRLAFYLFPGILLWYLLLNSGVHATIVGVLLAFAIPFGNGDENSPSYRLQHFLHKPVALLIMPLFAIANTGVVFSADWLETLSTSNSAGIFAGLVLGKPLGIFLFSLLAIRLGLSQLPTGVSWRHIIGVGFLGGIGFTMSIFITLLAFTDPLIIQGSKITILFSSLIAATIGFVILGLSSGYKRAGSEAG